MRKKEGKINNRSFSYRRRLVLQAVPGTDVDNGDSGGEVRAEEALLLRWW